MEFEEINIPADLAGLSREAFDALRNRVTEAGRATAALARSTEGDERAAAIEALNQLREAKAKLEAEGERRDGETAEADAAIAEAEAEFTEDSNEDEVEDDDANDEDNENNDDEDEEDVDAEAVEDDAKEKVVASAKPMKIRAAARSREIPATGGGRNTHRAPSDDLVDRWSSAVRRATSGTTERFMSFSPIEGGEVVMGNQSAEHNTRIMRAAKPEGNDAFLAAAGGWECGAAEVLSGIEQCGRTDRPIGSLIGSFTARGKALYHRQVGLDAVFDEGTAIWTEADDIATDPDDSATWKPCYILDCVDAIESCPVAIPMCFQVGVGQEWASPEQVAAALAKFDVALARRSESAILQRLHEQSNQYTYTPPVNESVTNTTIRLVGQLLQLAGYNGRNAIDGYTLVLPEALLLQIITDAALKSWVGPTTMRADVIAQLEDRFQINVAVAADVRSGDGTATGEVPAPTDVLPAAPLPAGGALPCPHTRFEVLLADLNDFRVGVHDVNLDVRTAINEARQNIRTMFSESFLTTEKLGCKPSFSVLMNDALVSGGQPDLTALDTAYCAGPTPDPYSDFPGTPLCA